MSTERLVPEIAREWLVADGRGAFAMGTPEGLRTRKYHGFYLGIAGRDEAAFLADFEMCANGIPLWPHRYRAEPQPVISPDPGGMNFSYREGPNGPEWNWSLEGGAPETSIALRFAVSSPRAGIIELQWSSEKGFVDLEIRPLFPMRPLHAVGGYRWSLEREESDETTSLTQESRDWMARIRGDIEDGIVTESVHLRLRGGWRWDADPLWYQGFLYTEELERGYPGEENIFSAGLWSIRLAEGTSGRISLAKEPESLVYLNSSADSSNRPVVRGRARDFILENPPGVVAGYPWFGEWGRDTFISLPGLAMSWIENGGDPAEVSAWAEAVLSRWAQWIPLTGMLPNLIEKNGSHQWESADATLWWCHSLAALWAFRQAGCPAFDGFDKKFAHLLGQAIHSIGTQRHLFLRVARDGALEVTEPHTTWMDARVEGCAVTPRTGRLPEINALWFQARCLQALWSEEIQPAKLESMGRSILSPHENERPNFIFLHSIPLAPSFVLGDRVSLRRDLVRAEAFWTPVGLRSLDPSDPSYVARCIGTQLERDRAYHQGTVWGFLGGHFEMAKDRAELELSAWESFPERSLSEMPISGHISEIFDAEPPFVPRGAPAQAWSLACLEESRARRTFGLDTKLSEILARRWKGRASRRAQGLRSEAEEEHSP